MRIVLVTDSFYPREGGAERQLRRVCGELVKDSGWEAVVVARRFAGMEPHEVIDGIVVERCGPPAGGLPGTAWASLLSACKVARLRPDAIIALQVGSSAVAAVAGSRLRGRRHPPVVIRLTGGSAAGSELAIRAASPKARPIVSALLRLCDTVVAPAHHLLDEPGPFATVLRAKGIVIPNGVEGAIDARAAGDCVVWMGRPDPVKGFDAFVALARQCPDLQFLAIGPPPSGDFPANLECTGWVDDPGPHLASAAVFVSTSKFEGSPNSALEALAGAIPVIAWDIPAYRELAEAMAAGVTLVPIGDVPAMASEVQRVMAERVVTQADRDGSAVAAPFPVPRLGDVTARWRDLLKGQSTALEVTRSSMAVAERRPKSGGWSDTKRRLTTTRKSGLRPRSGPEDSMRIALVIGTLGVGGAETQLCRLACEFARRGHTVHVFALLSGGPLSEVLDEGHVPYTVQRWSGFVYRDVNRIIAFDLIVESITGLLRIWRALWRFEPDVCHAFLGWAYMVAMPAAALRRVPVRISGRRSLSRSRYMTFRKWEHGLHHLSVAASNAILANSTEVGLDVDRTEPCARGKIGVIPNGVDLPDVIADPTTDPPIGIMIANLIEYKGHQDLLAALAMLSAPPVVRLIGDGPERGVLERTVQELGLGHVVRFEGSVYEGRRLLAQAQFAILASHEEGMPNAVLEAMACGLPVIATEVGGVLDLIDDGVNGVLVPPHNPPALAEAISGLAGDPALRARLGKAARYKMQSFGWSHCADAHLELYRHLYSRRGVSDSGYGLQPSKFKVPGFHAVVQVGDQP